MDSSSLTKPWYLSPFLNVNAQSKSILKLKRIFYGFSINPLLHDHYINCWVLWVTIHLLISRNPSRSLVLPLRRTPSIWARKLWSPLQVNSIITLGCSVSFDSLCNRWKQVWICWWEPYVADLMTSIVHVLSYILKFSFWWHWQYGANTTRHSIDYDDYLQSSLCLCKCFFFSFSRMCDRLFTATSHPLSEFIFFLNNHCQQLSDMVEVNIMHELASTSFSVLVVSVTLAFTEHW